MSIFNNNAAYPVIDLIRRELRRQGMTEERIQFDLDRSPDVTLYRNDPDDKFLMTDCVEDYGDFKIAYSIGRGYVIPIQSSPATPISRAELNYINKYRTNSLSISLVVDGKTTKAYTIGLNYDGNGLFVNSSVTETEV